MGGTLRKALRKSESELIAWVPEVEEFLKKQGASAGAISRVQIIFEEMILNLVKHALVSATQDIDLRLDVAADRILIQIEDDSAPFDPRWAPEFDKTKPLEERQTGGMGLQIVRSMVSEIHYERRVGRNHLRMVVVNP
jgi:anti-sigma regulatory factor (Ser/Thr protein kinase)